MEDSWKLGTRVMTQMRGDQCKWSQYAHAVQQDFPVYWHKMPPYVPASNCHVLLSQTLVEKKPSLTPDSGRAITQGLVGTG